MASSRTPTKSSNSQDIASPSAKRALDFDFWTQIKAKIPKVIEEDLNEFKIKDLTVTRRFEGKVLLRCSALFKFPNVLKLACDDGTNKVTVSAFGNLAQQLEYIAVNDLFFLAQFQVKKNDKMEYLSGSFEKLEIVASDTTAVVAAKESHLSAFPYEWKSILDIKSLPDYTVIDVLAIVAKDWGTTTTSNGSRKLDLSLTDKTMETIRFTLWDSADQLVGNEHQVVAIGRASVSSFQGTKMLSAKWYTHFKINPEMQEAEQLLKWFNEEMQQ